MTTRSNISQQNMKSMIYKYIILHMFVYPGLRW